MDQEGEQWRKYGRRRTVNESAPYYGNIFGEMWHGYKIASGLTHAGTTPSRPSVGRHAVVELLGSMTDDWMGDAMGGGDGKLSGGLARNAYVALTKNDRQVLHRDSGPGKSCDSGKIGRGVWWMTGELEGCGETGGVVCCQVDRIVVA